MFGAFSLDARTLTFCQLYNGFSIKPLLVKLLAGVCRKQPSHGQVLEGNGSPKRNRPVSLSPKKWAATFNLTIRGDDVGYTQLPWLAYQTPIPSLGQAYWSAILCGGKHGGLNCLTSTGVTHFPEQVMSAGCQKPCKPKNPFNLINTSNF